MVTTYIEMYISVSLCFCVITFRVRRGQGEKYIGHSRLSVCLCMCVCEILRACVCLCRSCAAFSQHVTLANDRGCLLVVHYWADLQSVRRFCCYDNMHVRIQCYRLTLQYKRVLIVLMLFDNSESSLAFCKFATMVVFSLLSVKFSKALHRTRNISQDACTCFVAGYILYEA